MEELLRDARESAGGHLSESRQWKITYKGKSYKFCGAVNASRDLKYPPIKTQYISCCRWGDRNALLECARRGDF
jgi:YHS domain-containing protein